MFRGVVSLALLSLFVGCGSDPFGPGLGPTVGPELDGVRLEITASREVEFGEEVVFHVSLSNVGVEPYVFDGFPFDVFVLDSRGRVLWNYFFGGADVGTQHVTIELGEAYEFDLLWHQERNGGGTVPAGTYRAFAAFYPPLPPSLISDRKSITIAD